MYFLKSFLIVSILFFGIGLSAQDRAEITQRSEIKVNTLYLVLGAFELDYEYIINEESSVGLSATIFFDQDVLYKWGVTPHYRLYFGKQPALGLFVEGHASVFRFEEDYYDYGPDGGSFGVYTEARETMAGIGIALGGKFKTSRNVVVEVNAGLGRVFGDQYLLGTYPRFGVNIGKRF